MSGPSKQRSVAEIVLALCLGLGLVAGLVYVLSARQQVLRASPAGFDGLQIWLASEGISSQSFSGGWRIDQNSVGLLVVPLFDTRLLSDRVPPATKDELLMQSDEYDLSAGAIRVKSRRVQTLVILPKWRTGMRLTGLAHPVLLNDSMSLEPLMFGAIGDRDAQFYRADEAFTAFRYRTQEGRDLQALLYAAQTFTSPLCTPIIGAYRGMVLGDCDVGLQDQEGSRRVLVLSDPDLLNNHGLRLGDNAAIVRDLIAARAGDRNVVIDYSRDMWLIDRQEGVTRERTWADLQRFFGPPFLALWLGAGGLLLACVWRAARRFGPVQGATRDRGGLPLAIAARARLMRLSDQDGALTGEYARARLAATAARIFGPAYGRDYAQPQAFLAYVARRHPAHAPALKALWAQIETLPPRISSAQAIRHVEDLEAILEHITNDT